jgi:protein-tyrosine phosphatase
MAEGIAKQMAADRGLDLEIDSAGTASYHAGERPDPRTSEVLARHGAPFEGRARQVTANDFEHFDLILAMDRSNYDTLVERCPEPLRHKIHLALELVGGGDVPDPYYGGPGGFESNYNVLNEAISAWLSRLG